MRNRAHRALVAHEMVNNTGMIMENLGLIFLEVASYDKHSFTILCCSEF
jgi:hypothetical protein